MDTSDSSALAGGNLYSCWRVLGERLPGTRLELERRELLRPGRTASGASCNLMAGGAGLLQDRDRPGFWLAAEEASLLGRGCKLADRECPWLVFRIGIAPTASFALVLGGVSDARDTIDKLLL